jgi:hypothetical protein
MGEDDEKKDALGNVIPSTPKIDYSMDWPAFHKANPNVGFNVFLPESSKYRKENNLPQYTPYEVWNYGQMNFEEEQKKDDQTYKGQQMITNIGDFLGNLLNVVRTNNGHVNYQLDMDTQRNRLAGLHQQQYAERRQRMQDMLGAWRQSQQEDRQQALDAASQADADRNYELKLNQWRANAARQAKLDEDAAAKQKEEAARKDKAAAEGERHNRAMESIGWFNAKNKDGSGVGVRESFTVTGGGTYVRNAPLSSQEAQNIIQNFGNSDQKDRAVRTFTNTNPDVLGIASEILASGQVPVRVIEGMNFKQTAKYMPPSLGWGASSGNNNETDW